MWNSIYTNPNFYFCQNKEKRNFRKFRMLRLQIEVLQSDSYMLCEHIYVLGGITIVFCHGLVRNIMERHPEAR